MTTFIDQAKIEVKAGKGGAGSVSFRREKFIPRGGPDGGDGGRGGHVIIRATSHLRTLLEFKYKKIFHSENGSPGRGRCCHGRNGKDLTVPVPIGTVVIDESNGETVADLTDHGMTFIAASGGRGGLGNSHFATSTHQTPRFAQPGEPGESRSLVLELKLLADVGLIGFPNSGKSTLISRISAAKPKIADYPFTTLIPTLGVVRRGADRSFVVADIPGLIEGSHEGKGLGLQFLRHVERSSILIMLVDASDWADPPSAEAPEALFRELSHYKIQLIPRVKAIVATKADLVVNQDTVSVLEAMASQRGIAFFMISSATGQGLNEMLDFLEHQLAKETEKSG